MRSQLLSILIVLAVSPSGGADPSVSPGDSAPESAAQPSPHGNDGDQEAAAAILAARQKAVDDIRAGRPGPYFFAPPPSPPSRPSPAPRAAD